MQILIDKQIHAELAKLMHTSSKFYISTAWASTGFDAYDALRENQDCITRMVVGLHFYQTSPDFIAEFMGNEKVRFVINPSGVFHAKVFLFENDDGRWKCIVGSANFTRSASMMNTEVAVLISSEDTDAQAALEQIKSSIKNHWNMGFSFTEDQYETYKNAYKRKQQSIERLAGTYGRSQRKKPPSPLSSSIFTMSWRAYFERIKEENAVKHSERIHVIKNARLLFQEYESLSRMTYENRKIIAGFATEPETPTDTEHRWNLFGSTKGVGYFMQAIAQDIQGISKALDVIPIIGPVTSKNYIEYIRLLEKAFKRSGLPTATRLLAMKRPDYFFCFNSKNKKAFSKEFGIPASRIDMENYWEEAIERIIDSNWWNSDAPNDENEKIVWSARVAFLDALFYEE